MTFVVDLLILITFSNPVFFVRIAPLLCDAFWLRGEVIPVALSMQ